MSVAMIGLLQRLVTLTVAATMGGYGLLSLLRGRFDIAADRGAGGAAQIVLQGPAMWVASLGCLLFAAGLVLFTMGDSRRRQVLLLLVCGGAMLVGAMLLPRG